MVTHRHHLTTVERQRIAALWQAVTGLRPRITVTVSRIAKLMVRVTISYPRSSQGYNGLSSHRIVRTDALVAATRLAELAIIAPSELDLPYPQRDRLVDILYRYFETGRVMPDALADVAMLPRCHQLAVFFAPFV